MSALRQGIKYKEFMGLRPFFLFDASKYGMEVALAATTYRGKTMKT
jgi:hypothetical protein